MLTFKPELPRETTWLRLAEPGTALVMLDPWCGHTTAPPKRDESK
jgi:hypothetical protein